MNANMMTFIKNIRFKPNISALIPADDSMGIPMIGNEMIYIPFFQVFSEEVCALDAEIFIEYPSGTVCSYQKAKETIKISYDAKKLLALKRNLLGLQTTTTSKELIVEISSVSKEMALIYEKAAKELEK